MKPPPSRAAGPGDAEVVLTALSYTVEGLAWLAGTTNDRSAWQESYDRLARVVPSGGLILDLGCGGGEDAPALAKLSYRVVGIDISAPLLDQARRRDELRGRVCLADLRSLPFADETFEGVWADGSVHHVTKAGFHVVAREVARVLKPGGGFGLSVERGLHDGYVEAADNVQGKRWYSYFEPDELRAILRRYGIDVTDAYFGGPQASSAGGFTAIFARKRQRDIAPTLRETGQPQGRAE